MRKEYNKNKKKLRNNRRKNKILKVIKTVFIYGSITFVVLLFGILGYFYKEYKPMLQEIYDNAMAKVEQIDDKTFKDKSNSILYYEDGSVMKQLNIHDYKYIEYSQIPSTVEDALLSIEDIRYYEHDGVDLKAVARAGYQLIKNKGEKTQGGSTITQQLVKLKFLTLEKSYERKLEEMIIAYHLEKKFSKTEILEFYLNTINYGSGAYGIESAANKYFSKSIKELTLSEIAFLTGIPNNPSLYSPITNYDNAIKRRDLILAQMLKYEKITEKEYTEAIKQEIVLNVKETVYEPDNYEVSFVISSAAKEIMRKNDFEFRYWFDSEADRNEYLALYNAEFKEAESIVRNGGFKIYSTIQKDKQDLLQKTINEKMSVYTGKDSKTGLYKTQASAVSVDNVKGELIAIVGGRTQEDIANTYNRAFLSNRQPGSAIKPLLVYLPLLEKGILATNTFTDEKDAKGPNNVDFRYRGRMTVSEAVARSVNTIPFKITVKYGARNLLSYLEGLEFSGLDYRDNNNTVGIGGFTYGTNTYEMANGFYTIVNGGEYVRLTGIKKIIDNYGDVYYEDEKEGKQVFDSGTSYLMTDILKGVFTESYGTAYRDKLARQDIEVAGKTGTTNGYRDLWMVGYTPYYTTSVWLGNDTPASLNNGAYYSKEIWRSYMDAIHKGLEAKEFEVPKRIKMAYVNPANGQVSDTEKSGWVKQWVTAVYLEKLAAEKAEADAKARAAEIARQQKEKEERERYAKERAEKLKSLGMTEADVESEKEKGIEILRELIYLDIVEIEEYDSKVIPILKKVDNELKVIKFDETYKELKQIYDEESNRLLNKKKKLEQVKLEEEKAEIERQKALEEAQKQADEKAKAEEEARIQEEVNKRLEEERLKQEEEERKKQEEEQKNNNPNPNNNNPNNNSEPPVNENKNAPVTDSNE